MAIKETAKGKIEGAEKLYSDAQSSEGAAGAKDELKGAKEALDQSKTLFQDSKFKESILSADESARLSNIVMGSLNQSAKEKIASAEGMYTQAKNSAGAAIAVSQLNEAGNALDLSKSQYKESKYKESIASAAESERLSKIVINTKAKEDKVLQEGKAGRSLEKALMWSFQTNILYIRSGIFPREEIACGESLKNITAILSTGSIYIKQIQIKYITRILYGLICLLRSLK